MGLLQQIQKRKTGNLSVDELITTPQYTKREEQRTESTESEPPESEPRQAGEQSAEDLLAALVAESSKQVSMPKPASESDNGTKDTTVAKTQTANSDSDSFRIVRSRKTAKTAKPAKKKTEDRLPWWLTEGKKTTPQVELLVPEARKVLNEILPTDSDKPVDLPASVKRAVHLAAEMLRGEVRVTAKDQEIAEKELLSLLTGKGPLQPLYDDKAVTDIFIDDHKSIRVIRRGQAIETPFYFRSKEEYKAYLANMLQSVDRVLNLSSPIVDCVLADGFRSRINAVDSSVIDGDEPRVCIRVPRLQKISFYDILQTKTLPATLAAWLAELTATGEANIMVLGPTGSGKTVMTTALLSAVGSDERIITIEDVPEVFVPTSHLEKLVSRPANAQGEGAIKMPQLLKAALRRAPHRIVVGEIRDEEGSLFLRALETGHAGSIATIHADSPRDCLWRLLDVVQAYESAPQDSLMRRIARSLHILIEQRKVDGKPCLVEVAEVCPPVNGEFVTKPIVRYEGTLDGRRTWRIMTKNSAWMEKIRERGLDLQPGPGLLDLDSPEKPKPPRKI
ncbi:MAG: CpaF family protein [Bdellovibrionales bacterium]|nr:CpaF family protein [Bdellovibrionales bacterium]